MILILLGPPGAGKGTISNLLSEKNGFIHVSTGNLFREVIGAKKLTKIQKQIKKTLEQGKLIEDKITIEYLFEALSKYDLNKEKIILDGVPRTVKQAELIGEYFTKNNIVDIYFISFDISKDVVIDRLEHRLTCPTCGRVFNKLLNPPKEDGICDYDGTKLVKRADDYSDKIVKRFEEYQEKTLPLFEFYEERIYHLDASKQPELIYQDLLKLIGIK